MNLTKRVETKTLADSLPYLHFDQESGALWLKDGSVAKTFEIIPKNVLSTTEDELEILRQGLNSILNQAPEGALLQFYFVRERTTEESDIAGSQWKKCHSTETENLKPASELLFNSKLDMFQNLWKTGGLFQCRVYLTIRLPADFKASSFGKLGPLAFLAFGRVKKENLKNPSLLVNEIQEIYSQLKTGFESHGFETKDLDFETLAKIIFKFLNPERASVNPNLRVGTEGCNDLSEAISLTDFIESRKGISLGRTQVRIGTLKALPKESYPGLMTYLASEAHEFVIVNTILVLSQTKEKERLSRKQKFASGMASGNSVRNLTAESILEDTEETLSALVAGEKLFASSFHLVSFETADTESDQFQQLIDVCERMGEGCQWFEETVGAYPVFFGILPFAPTFITRPKRIRSAHMGDLLPIYGMGPGHDEASLIFETPYKSLMNFSLFEKSPSANGIVIGSTGSGKSTLACGILLGMAAECGL
jgi:type IV secretory pathway VirB4 component